MKRLTSYHLGEKSAAYMACSRTCTCDSLCGDCAELGKIIARLAAYEDAMPLERSRELSQAEKDGRLAALPPVSESASAFQKNLDVFELSIAIKWAHAAALMDENPEVSHLFLLSEIALNEKLERLVNAQPLSDQLTREEAEAALKKREADNAET